MTSSLVALSVLALGFLCVLVAYHCLPPSRPLSMRAVSIVRGSTCYADLHATFHDVGMLEGRALRAYERHTNGWRSWGECQTGTLVDVSDAMLQGWKADEVLRVEEEEQYEVLKQRAAFIRAKKER